MIDLPIAVSSPASAPGRRAPANALQQNTGLPGATQADESSFHDALVQMLGNGPGDSFSAGGDTAVASLKADSNKKTGAQTDPALDASALPVGLALPLPPLLAPALALIPASARQAGLGTVVASSKADISQEIGAKTDPALDTTALPAGLALPLLPLLAPALALIPASARQAGLGTVVASSKADSSRKTAADTAPALDASALPSGLAQPHLMPKIAPADALSTDHSEPLKDVLSTAVFATANPRTEPRAAFSTAAQVIENGSAIPTRSVPEPSGTVEARVGERGWDQGVGEKLVWMVNQKHQVAQLHLNPPDLGPLKITISLDQNQASAQFFSAHASVREAIEVAMPRLREMLADSGITLGNASVGTEAFREPAQQPSRGHVVQSVATAVDSGTVSSGERLLRPMHGLVDTFA